MKMLITAIVLTTALSTPVFSASHHQHGNDQKATGMKGGMMMGMMDNDQMMKMHEHMQAMQGLMAEIKQEDNLQKRQELMQKHMESMQGGMGMMMGTMKGKPENKDKMDMSSMQMNDRMGMMEKRMDMMQMMMGQMIEHNTEEKKQQKH